MLPTNTTRTTEASPTPPTQQDDFDPSNTMPPLARRLLITAAIDGLILQPLQNSRSRTPPASPDGASVKLEYKTNKITPYATDKQLTLKEEGTSIEAHGIIGTKAEASTVH